ncbi:MAG: hypothetical protein WA131_07500 [Desulfitobacteriaceae bacterium]
MEDIELRQIFGRLFEKVDALDVKFNALDGKFNVLDGKFNALDQKVSSLDGKFNALDQKVTKNTIQIESIQSDIKIIVEVQKAHMEQNERDYKNILEHIGNKTDLIETVLKRHSEEITTLKRKIG